MFAIYHMPDVGLFMAGYRVAFLADHKCLITVTSSTSNKMSA